MSNNPFNNGVHNTSAPTLTNGQSSPVQLDVNGNLMVASLPAGSAVIGHVIVDSAPSTAVTGTVSVSNFPGSQVVTLASTTITGSVAVTGTFFQATQPVSLVSLPALSAGSAVIGHVVVDSAPTTAVTGTVSVSGSVAVTGTFFQATQPVSLTSLPALTAGSAVIGHVIVDTAPTTTVTGTVSVNALPAGTNLIGAVSASAETSTIYNGTTALTPQFATVVASASGVTTIIALTAGKKIRVLAMQLTANASVNVKWQSHVTPTDITGLAYLASNGGYVLPFNPAGWFQTISGEALDINLSGAVAVGGSITYVTV